MTRNKTCLVQRRKKSNSKTSRGTKWKNKNLKIERKCESETFESNNIILVRLKN